MFPIEIVQNCSKVALMPMIQGKTLEGIILYINGWRAEDGFIPNGYGQVRVSVQKINSHLVNAMSMALNP